MITLIVTTVVEFNNDENFQKFIDLDARRVTGFPDELREARRTGKQVKILIARTDRIGYTTVEVKDDEFRT